MIELHELRGVLPQRMASHPTSALLLVTQGSVPEGFNGHARLRVTSTYPSGPSDCRGVTAILFVPPFDAKEVAGFERWVQTTRQPIIVWKSDEPLSLLAPLISKALNITISVEPIVDVPLPTKGTIRFRKELDDDEDEEEEAPRRRKKRARRIKVPARAQKPVPPVAPTPPPAAVQKVELTPPLPEPVKPTPEPRATPSPRSTRKSVDIVLPSGRVARSRPNRTDGNYGRGRDFIVAHMRPVWEHLTVEVDYLIKKAAEENLTLLRGTAINIVSGLERDGLIPQRIRKDDKFRDGELMEYVLAKFNPDRVSNSADIRSIYASTVEGPKHTTLGSVRSAFHILRRAGKIPPLKPRPKPMTILTWVPLRIKTDWADDREEASRLEGVARGEGYPWKAKSLYNSIRNLVRRGTLKPPEKSWTARLRAEVAKLRSRVAELEAENAKLRGEQPKSNTSS